MDEHTEHDTPVRAATDDRGASLVEYAMLLALIAFVCIGALTFFGSQEAGSIDGSADSIVEAGN